MKNLTRTNLHLDLTIFAGFMIAAAPALTGDALHEWLGVVLAAGFTAHLLLHWRWIVEVTRRFFRTTAHGSQLNYLLNTGLFIAFTLITFSGVMMSKSVLPLLGLSGSRGFFWHALHAQATNVALLLVGLHLALHWKWIVFNLRRPAAGAVGRFASTAPAAPLHPISVRSDPDRTAKGSSQ